jgi:hypothetical protein
VPFSLIAWSQSHVASGLAAILNATTPLFAVVLAHYLTGDERMTPAGSAVSSTSPASSLSARRRAGHRRRAPARTCLPRRALAPALSVIFARRFSRRGITLTAAAGLTTASLQHAAGLARHRSAVDFADRGHRRDLALATLSTMLASSSTTHPATASSVNSSW